MKHTYRITPVVPPLYLVFVLLLPVYIQAQQPEGSFYVVKEGDSLWDIAIRFGISLHSLQEVNAINDANQLALGMNLVIPGIKGFEGEIDTVTVGYGETLSSLSRRFKIPVNDLIQLNHLASPSQLYAGRSLVLPSDRVVMSSERVWIVPGQSLLEMAIGLNQNPWSLVMENNLSGAWAGLPGDVLHLPSADIVNGPGALPETISTITLNPTLPVQGGTLVIKVVGKEGLTLDGSVAGRQLNFFPTEDGYIALQGIHAMLEPGPYSLVLTSTLPVEQSNNRAEFKFSQPIIVRDGDYVFDPPLTVDPATIDPRVTDPEDQFWNSLGLSASPQKMWQGSFQSPVPKDFQDCWPSLFGNRRSFNGSAYIYFHSGLDFCGGIGTEIYAPAAGKVIFTGPLTVRGNATVIDHGWGVYTAYDHQSEVYIAKGDMVEPGQLIGRGGATGRVTGPHLHWEVWVGGVQVNPLDWLNSIKP